MYTHIYKTVDHIWDDRIVKHEFGENLGEPEAGRLFSLVVCLESLLLMYLLHKREGGIGHVRTVVHTVGVRPRAATGLVWPTGWRRFRVGFVLRMDG